MPKRKKKVTKKNVSNIEIKVSGILKSLGVDYEQQVKIGKYNVDFLVEGKYIVECYGDFWHCNPHQYTSSYFNRGKKMTAEEIWNRDKKRKDYLESIGYKFLCLWESDINKNSKVVKSKIKKILDKQKE